MRCLMCGKEMTETGSLTNVLFWQDVLCQECRSNWERIHGSFEFQGIRAEAVWKYNDAYRSALIQFKELGDEALKDVFFLPVHEMLHGKYRGWTLCLLPSTQQKREARGFSHLAEMYECLHLEMLEPFEKCTDADQKRASARQRRKMAEEIRLIDGLVLPEKIVLCDDVMTTGSTMKGALSCIDLSSHRVRILVNSLVEKRDIKGSPALMKR